MADTNDPLPCQRCGSPTVGIELLDGAARLTMRSCSRCDHRTWSRGGEPARLREVLAKVTEDSSRRRTA